MSGWKRTPLEGIFEIARGGSPRPIQNFLTDDPDGLNWIMIGDAVGGSKYISTTKNRIRRDGLKKSRMVHEGDFLLTNSMSFGRPYILKTSGCIHDGWLVLSPKDHNVYPDFFYYLLGSDLLYREFTKRAAGAVVKNLNTNLVKSLEVPLPPLPEQKRIAGILDAADALRAKRRDSLAQLDALLQSIFLDMFGDPVTNSIGFPKQKLMKAFRFTTGKLDSNAGVKGGKYPFFTCARETFAIDSYAFDCEALFLAGNNANADYSVKHYRGKFNAYQRTYVITVDEETFTYPYAQVALEYMLGDLKRFSKGTNTKYLTMSILNRMPILVPPISMQRRFATIVESVEQQKARLHAHLAELDALFASLQSRAFNGEL